MGAGGALGCVSPGGVAERDGGGARDHHGEAAETDARCACDAAERAQAGEGAAGETCAKETLNRRRGRHSVSWSRCGWPRGCPKRIRYGERRRLTKGGLQG